MFKILQFHCNAILCFAGDFIIVPPTTLRHRLTWGMILDLTFMAICIPCISRILDPSLDSLSEARIWRNCACCWLRIALYFCSASLYSLNLLTAICLRLMYFVVCLSFHIMATRRRPYYLGSSHDGLWKWASLSPLPVACGTPPPVIFWGGGFRQPLMPQ